ncbi:MAG: NAD(P)H-dependent oxidoreductase subunit E, partial [Candidatus Eisenbacteria bacterium]|nr:NAD(P)H-dependent oxidoreductase subunit E [Candidatus Eisenbacteria bacterium]
ELTEMYADDELDRKNVSVVCSGRAASHARMGVLNFSFYDWRKRTARIKQAGRGGIGTVFRHKRLKALVVKNRGINPAWSVTESPAAKEVAPKRLIEVKDAAGRAALREIIAEKWRGDPEHAIDMLRDVQARFGCVPRTALDEITLATSTPTAYLYHLVTFMEGFDLEPRGEIPIRVCTGTACRLNGAAELLAAFEQALGVKAGETTGDGRYSLRAGSCTGSGGAVAGPCLGPCGAAPVVLVGDQPYGGVAPGDVAALLANAAGAVAPSAATGAAAGAPPAAAAAGAGGAGGAAAQSSRAAAAPDQAPMKARVLTSEERAQVAAEQEAYAARARALLAICTGKRTPAGSAKGAKDPSGEAPGSGKPGGSVFLCGQVARPGVARVPEGATLREVVDGLGGGVIAGGAFKAMQAGGPSGRFLTAADLDRPVDFAALATSGSMTGPDRAIVFAEGACMVGAARDAAEFLLGQSCGKCTPCREGLLACAGALGRLARGEGREADIL